MHSSGLFTSENFIVCIKSGLHMNSVGYVKNGWFSFQNVLLFLLSHTRLQTKTPFTQVVYISRFALYFMYMGRGWAGGLGGGGGLSVVCLKVSLM